MKSKPLYDREEARTLIATWKSEGKTVVAVSGSFDILHEGHAFLLSEARGQGDKLIMLLNSDASVRAYKGPGKPVHPQEDRAAAILAMYVVDAIVLFNETTTLSLITELQPDVFVNSAEYGDTPLERPVVESYGGRVYVVSRLPGLSSSNLVSDEAKEGELHKRAVLFDRDGTLIENTGYLHEPEKIVWKKDAMQSLSRIQSAGYKLFVITNQSGIGRGMFDIDAVERVHERMREDLASADLTVTAFYYCPHAPDTGCDCRKPAPGMLLSAAHDHDLNLSKSWFIGDTCSDIEAGKRANTRTILISNEACEYDPSALCQNLSEATDLILSES